MRSFCSFITDPAYGWAAACEDRFGTHPVQVVHEWNSAVHVEEAEADVGKRAFTHDELQAFFDYADDQVDNLRGRGRRGWLQAFRDAVLFKTAYAFGLRRNETRMLDTVDFGRNPEGPEFGDYGVLYVRHGKAKKGSPPKHRSVLTVWDWSAEILQQWNEEVRPHFTNAGARALWPSERSARIGFSQMNTRFAAYRDALGLDENLDFHSFRRSGSERPLSHDGLSMLSPWRSVAHVRDLLMHSGVLPHRDRRLLLFERRLPGWLDAVENPEHRTLLHRFATWHVLRKLRTTADKQPLEAGAVTSARARLTQAAAFLACSANAAGTSTNAPRPTWTPGMPRTPSAAASSNRFCVGPWILTRCPA
ncbi:tyrosine-type recombinase/integrase [Streptomyces sp. NPDC001020]